jgi:hypothetical protein
MSQTIGKIDLLNIKKIVAPIDFIITKNSSAKNQMA